MIKTKEISFGDQTFEILANGLLYWPTEKIMVVSDLHLEKGSFYGAKSGQFLPPHDSVASLEVLVQTLQAFDVERLIFLGDNFHDYDGFARLENAAKTLLSDLISAYEIIWIEGNHDHGFVPEGLRAYDFYQHQGIHFVHVFGDAGAADFEISGHYHPVVNLRHRGKKIRGKALIHDAHKMILPSFGAYTGGLDVEDDVIKNLGWAQKKLYLLNQAAIIKIK